MNELLKLENINVTFAKKRNLLSDEKYIHVLKNINLDVQQGEILAIVGESGCGKTTTGKVITGLIKPTSGKIYYNDKPYIEKNVVQFVQQDSYAALNPVNTIYESMYYAIKSNDKHLKRKDIDEKINNLMHVIGLEPAIQFLDKYPHQLSGGQRQRILIARALSLNPKIIVADEPVSMIDVSLRLSILNMMSTLNETMGVTFIYITHDLSTARYIAKNGRICVMYLGEIVEIGDLNTIISSPQHPYTKALLMAVPDINHNFYGELPIKSMDLGDLTKRTKGCPFANRCIYKTDECDNEIEYITINNVKVKCCNISKIQKELNHE